MDRKERVVITGLGAITSLGCDYSQFSKSIQRGLSPRKKPTFLSSYEQDIHVYGIPNDLDLREFVKKKKALKIMSRTIQLAVVASRIAYDHARLEEDNLDVQRAGVSLATGIINYELDEMLSAISKSHTHNQFDLCKFGKNGLDALFPLWALKYIPNMPACHISIENNLQGPSNTQTSSNASGLYAIAEAMHVIQRGDADMMIAGGTGSHIDPLSIAHLQKQALLRTEKIPGVEVGEGAASMVLESYEHAKKRKAKIYGEVLGFSSNYDLDVEQDDAKFRCIKNAIRQANLEPQDIDFVIANACGNVDLDSAEDRALELCGLKNKPIVKMKDWFGYIEHTSGVLENNFALFCMNQGDQEGILNTLAGQDAFKKNTFLINAFGLYGHNSCMVVKKNDGVINLG